MIGFLLAASVALIALHDVDGQVIFVNPEHIVLLHPTKEGVITKGVNCVVGLANGKRVSATEDCGTIGKLMEDAK